MSHDTDLGLAILVIENAPGVYEPLGVVGTVREAIEMAHQDLGARMAALEDGGEPLCPEHYVVWAARRDDGRYERYHTITPGRRPEARTPAPATSEASSPTLVLLPEGFLNLAQAVEYRLRYEDVTTSDAVVAIDVLMSDGASRLIKDDDPGFEQVIDAIESQGYVISTKERK